MNFDEMIDYFEEAREIIRQQDLSDKTIKYLIDIVDKDIKIIADKTTKRETQLEKALDSACAELEDFSADFTSKKVDRQEWKEQMLKESEKD